MKGSTKFWIMIGAATLLFLNYLCYKDVQDYDPNRLAGDTITIPTVLFLAIETIFSAMCLLEFIVYFCNEILPNFNKWLDEHF